MTPHQCLLSTLSKWKHPLGRVWLHTLKSGWESPCPANLAYYVHWMSHMWTPPRLTIVPLKIATWTTARLIRVTAGVAKRHYVRIWYREWAVISSTENVLAPVVSKYTRNNSIKQSYRYCFLYLEINNKNMSMGELTVFCINFYIIRWSDTTIAYFFWVPPSWHWVEPSWNLSKMTVSHNTFPEITRRYYCVLWRS